jgi:hypothetical protein
MKQCYETPTVFILFLKGIVLKFDPARWVDLGLEPGQVEEKTGKEKIWCDLTDPTG